jgi:hypothetical protein
MTDSPPEGPSARPVEAIEIEPQGDHQYVVRLGAGPDVVESWVRVTPEILDHLGATEEGEERLVDRTVAFLLRYQDAADFPAVVELEDVLAAYGGYAEAMAS